MDRFATAVGAAEQQGDELNLEAILAAASDGSLADGADVSVLKRVMRESIDQIKADSDRALERVDELKAKWQSFLEQQQVGESSPPPD